MRIIFMGTPEFAVESLKILVENGYNIVAVVTAPDKPAGRGNHLMLSDVKRYALSQNLTILQPTSLKAPEFLETLKTLKADLQIVVAFRMLPEVVWEMPPIGTFNLHASLLPKYRGAAPINWAIINGETETGVTTFFLKHEIDTGSIVFQEKEPISLNDNAEDLYHRLMQKGAKLVLKTVQAIEKKDFTTTPQTGEITHAPKIFRETCQIDWNTESQKIYNFVRGLAPYPAAWTTLGGKNCKIYQVNPLFQLPENHTNAISNTENYFTDHQTFLTFRSADGFVSVEDLHLEGKKRLKIQEFLKGFRG